VIKLGKVQVCGLDYSIKVSNGDETPALKGNEGITDYATCTIFLSDTLPETRALDTLVHEIIHAIFEASGADNYLKTKWRKGIKGAEVEEHLIRLLTPALITSFRSAGLLSRKKVRVQ